MPGDGEAENEAQNTDIKAHGCIFGHVDIFIVALFGSLTAFDGPQGIELVDCGRNGKIIEGRRRGYRPLQRSAVPRVAGEIPVLVALANALIKPINLDKDTAQDDESANSHGDKQRMPPRIGVIMVEAPCGPHKAEHVKRHKGEQEPGKPAPEGVAV